MKPRHAAMLVILAAQTCSCTWVRTIWAGREKEVPVSRPEKAAPSRSRDEIRETQQPAPPAAVQDEPLPATKPPVLVAPSTMPAEAKVLGEPRIVAASLVKVNDRFFSMDEIVSAAGPQLAKLPSGLPPALLRQRIGEIIATTIRDQIGQTLVLEEVNKRMTDELKERIESRVQGRLKEMIAGAGGSKKLLEQKLRAEGTTPERALEAYRDGLKVQSYLQDKFAPAIAVDRRMLWEHYRSHLEEFTTPKKVAMQIIAAPVNALLPAGTGDVTAGELAAAKARAKEHSTKAAAALKQGKDFGEVAKTFSKGIKASGEGVWPLMPAGSFRNTEVERAAFALKEGQVSGIVETEEGFFIVKAKRVIPEKVASFEEAQAGIEERLRTEQYNKLAAKYFDELYKSATISRSEELFHLAVERAVAKYLSQ